MPLMQFVGNFGYVMVCIVGAVLTINGDITIGTIVAFMTYVRIFTQPIGQMAQGITQLQSASAAMGRVFEFLDEEEMEDESQKHANWKRQKVMSPLSMFALVIHQIRLLSMTLQLKPSQDKRWPLLVRQVQVRRPWSIS